MDAIAVAIRTGRNGNCQRDKTRSWKIQRRNRIGEKKMRVNAKVVQIKRRGFTSLRFSLCRNYRDGHGRPRNEVLASFPTVRSTDVNDPDVQRKFWQKCDGEILRLMLEGRVMRNDLETAKQKFARYIPRPVPPASAPKTEPVAKVEPSIDRAVLFAKYPFLSKT